MDNGDDWPMAPQFDSGANSRSEEAPETSEPDDPPTIRSERVDILMFDLYRAVLAYLVTSKWNQDRDDYDPWDGEIFHQAMLEKRDELCEAFYNFTVPDEHKHQLRINGGSHLWHHNWDQDFALRLLVLHHEWPTWHLTDPSPAERDFHWMFRSLVLPYDGVHQLVYEVLGFPGHSMGKTHWNVGGTDIRVDPPGRKQRYARSFLNTLEEAKPNNGKRVRFEDEAEATGTTTPQAEPPAYPVYRWFVLALAAVVAPTIYEAVALAKDDGAPAYRKYWDCMVITVLLVCVLWLYRQLKPLQARQVGGELVSG